MSGNCCRRGDELPAELARREDHLATIEAAMRRLEAKAEAEAERQRLGGPCYNPQ